MEMKKDKNISKKKKRGGVKRRRTEW